MLIARIKNIRFTNQSPQCNIQHPEESGGFSGWAPEQGLAPFTDQVENDMETAMTAKTANIPVLPIAGGALVRAVLSLLAFVTRLLNDLARARRHRRDAMALAGLDRRMLADIGLNRADVSDAFSEPFWEDPTALLRERAIERRLNRSPVRPMIGGVENGFHRPPTDRPARHAI
jgi:uncharacterized protein YjiS (DUF1127 family)